MSQFNNRKRSAHGFSLVEVLVAVAILTIGLMSTAVLISRTLVGTDTARKMNLASLLASEKLEDLNRWPTADPHVAVPAGGVAGSLVADVTANINVGGVITPVNYFDDILEGQTPGTYSETVSGVDPVTGAVIFTTTTHAPDGTITTTVSNAAPGAGSFKRRWIIEADQPVVGVRRITVFVTNQDPLKPVTFQMTTVRP